MLKYYPLRKGNFPLWIVMTVPFVPYYTLPGFYSVHMLSNGVLVDLKVAKPTGSGVQSLSYPGNLLSAGNRILVLSSLYPSCFFYP